MIWTVILLSENDGLIGSINDLINNVSPTHRQKDARVKVGDQAKVLSNQVKVGKPFNKEGGEALKGKTPLKVKCTPSNFWFFEKNGYAWKKGHEARLDLDSYTRFLSCSFMSTI